MSSVSENDHNDDADGGGDDDSCWKEIRAQAKEVFLELAKQAADDENHIHTTESWVRRGLAAAAAAAAADDTKQEVIIDEEHDDDYTYRCRSSTTSANCRFFDYTGFLHVPNFATAMECNAMKQQMADLVEHQWDASATDMLDSFGTSDSHNTKRGDYFLESSDKVHFFAEPDALLLENSDDGEPQQENDKGNKEHTGVVVLKECYRDNKIAALNKAGHAMHIQNGAFRDYCLSPKVGNLVTDLGWQDPIIPQSMYIFKQAKHGGVVSSHQDSTFLYTTPRQTCLGLWLALDDADLDNGCLWVRPKSHTEPVRRQFKRNPLHFGDDVIRARGNEPAGDVTQPKFIMENLCQHDIAWEGTLPGNGGERDDDDDKKNDHAESGGSSSSSSNSSTIRSLLEAGFVPVECKAGDLLAFCGQLDHLSLTNTSNRPRHTFQLHLVEGPSAGVSWSESNWLQYPNGKPFLRLLGEEEEEEGQEAPRRTQS